MCNNIESKLCCKHEWKIEHHGIDIASMIVIQSIKKALVWWMGNYIFKNIVVHEIRSLLFSNKKLDDIIR